MNNRMGVLKQKSPRQVRLHEYQCGGSDTVCNGVSTDVPSAIHTHSVQWCLY